MEVIHGVASAPDGSKLYLTNESTEMLDIVDVRTLKVTNSIPLSGRPNNLAIHKDGHRVYVAIQGTGGGVDVIDTVNEELVKFIRILRGVHNTFITPDSKYVVGRVDRRRWCDCDRYRAPSGRPGRYISRAVCDR